VDKERNFRELLFADVALARGAADAVQVASALQRYWAEQVPSVADALALDADRRAEIEGEVAQAVDAAEGDAGVAVARRGGIDRDIHTSLRPETSAAVMRDGAGARAPLRTLTRERYRDFALVGKGGMGFVYLALDTELNRRVAFKMVRPDPSASEDTPAPETPLSLTPPSALDDEEETRSFEELKIRFLQEAWVTGAMEHPGVVPVYELGETAAGIPYYTMRYVKGERTLANAIADAGDLDARLALLEPFLKVCDAVAYAHSRDVVHRDLKPENIALGNFGEAIVLDWGLSKMEKRPDVAGSLWRSQIEEFRDATDLKTLAGALGTPGYMAPEAALGHSEDVGARSDIYSLGAILFQILTGRMPFLFRTFMEYVQKVLEAAPPVAHEVAPGVPSELSQVCARAMSRKREDRFGNVEELSTEVRRWQTEGRLKEQLNDLVSQAEAELVSASKAYGNMLLWYLDRASAACTRILHLKQDHPRALELAQAVKQLRERGIRERVRSSRRQAIVAVGFGILAVATIVALWFVGVLAEQRQEAEDRVQAAQNRASAYQVEAREARHDKGRTQKRLANLYAGLAEIHLRDGWVAAARVAAARALQFTPTAEGWAALARAAAQWTPTLEFVVHDLGATVVALAPDGARLYVGSRAGEDDHVVHAIDLRTGARETWKGPPAPITQMVLSPDGRRLCTVAKTLQVWDTKTGKIVHNLPPLASDPARAPNATADLKPVLASAGDVTTATFSHDGRHLFAGHQTGYILHWDLQRGVPAYFLQRAGASLTALHAGRHGKYLYCGDAAGEIARREIGHLDNSTVVDSGGDAAIATVRPAEDGSYIHACTVHRRLIMVELDPVRVFTEFQEPGGTARALIHDHRQHRIYAAGRQGVLQVWDVAERRLLARLDGFVGEITTLSLSHDRGRWLAVGREDGTVRVWDLRMGWRSGGAETASAVVGGHRRTYVARPDHSIEVWDNARDRALARLRGHESTITALALAPEQNLLVSASLDQTLGVWDLEKREAKATVRTAEPITALALPPGADAVYAGTLHGEIQVWAWRLRRKQAQFGEKGPPVARLAVDGDYLLVRDVEGALRAFDLRTQEQVPEREFAAAPTAGKAPVHGTMEPWVSKNALRRLIEAENRFGLMVVGSEVKVVPRDRYLPHRLRLDAWSR
jgi:serine/threonine protein kinase/WD40 repeat protein